MTIEFSAAGDELALDEVALLEIAAWGGKPDSEQVDARKQRLSGELDRLNPDTKSILVARESDIVLGICRVKQTAKDPQVWTLFGLAVHPDHRRRNIGRNLVKAGIGIARSHGARCIHSQTHAGNDASIAFHRALGFHEEGGFTDLDGDEKLAFSIGGFGPSYSGTMSDASMKRSPALPKEYFDKFSTAPVEIKPFDPRSRTVAETSMLKLREQLAGLDATILHGGSTRFGIAGKGDIEVRVYPVDNDWPAVLNKLEAHYGGAGKVRGELCALQQHARRL